MVGPLPKHHLVDNLIRLAYENETCPNIFSIWIKFNFVVEIELNIKNEREQMITESFVSSVISL